MLRFDELNEMEEARSHKVTFSPSLLLKLPVIISLPADVLWGLGRLRGGYVIISSHQLPQAVTNLPASQTLKTFYIYEYVGRLQRRLSRTSWLEILGHSEFYVYCMYYVRDSKYE